MAGRIPLMEREIDYEAMKGLERSMGIKGCAIKVRWAFGSMGNHWRGERIRTYGDFREFYECAMNGDLKQQVSRAKKGNSVRVDIQWSPQRLYDLHVGAYRQMGEKSRALLKEHMRSVNFSYPKPNFVDILDEVR